jgi:hypothetical protein
MIRPGALVPAFIVTIKAKPGYAVGAMAVKHGGGFDGMSVTFMKVAGDKLDPAASYESEFVGSDENKKPTKVTGNGVPVVGVWARPTPRTWPGWVCCSRARRSSRRRSDPPGGSVAPPGTRGAAAASRPMTTAR